MPLSSISQVKKRYKFLKSMMVPESKIRDTIMTELDGVPEMELKAAYPEWFPKPKPVATASPNPKPQKGWERDEPVTLMTKAQIRAFKKKPRTVHKIKKVRPVGQPQKNSTEPRVQGRGHSWNRINSETSSTYNPNNYVLGTPKIYYIPMGGKNR